jgi:pyruvate/2-oxoglutarate dehydrogenase complex dihydrolipoamide dehydrogenase (E3) component
MTERDRGTTEGTTGGGPPATDTADVVVVGLGPGGEDAAARLARAGLDVVGVDERLVGGECPYWACIPSKMMIRAADALVEGRRIEALGGTATVTPDWAPVARRIRDEATTDWDDTVAVERLEGAGARFVRGTGRLVGPRTVAVGDRVLAARRGVLLNPGTRAQVPPVDGLAGTPYWTNKEAIEVEHLPASLVVLGGGAIGCELAQVFARFGVRVTVVETADRLLPLDEPEAGSTLAEVFAGEGVDVRTRAAADKVAYDDASGFTVRLADGGEVTGERLLVATGRRADLVRLGVGAVGLDEKARFLDVDGRMRVADGLWAIGDVTGKGAFTHVSMYQARIAAADLLGESTDQGDYRAVPRVTFTDPEVGAVGLTEQQARDAGLEVRLGTSQVPSTARGFIHKEGNEGFVKLVADASRDVLVGATSAGPSGGEVLGLLALAVHAEVPLDRLRTMIYAYPTFHRGVEDALRDLDA